MPDAPDLPRRPLTAVLTIVTCTLLASCGGADAPPAEEPAQAEPSAVGAAADAPSVDACTLITREEAAAAIGQPVGEGARQDVSPVFSCRYNAASNVEMVDVSATAFPSAATAKEAYDMIVRTNDYEAVSGIGDRAYKPAISDLSVHKGRWELSITLVQPGTSKDELFEKAKNLASTAIARLPN